MLVEYPWEDLEISYKLYPKKGYFIDIVMRNFFTISLWVFFGMIGACVSGVTIDKYGRKKGLLGIYLVKFILDVPK